MTQGPLLELPTELIPVALGKFGRRISLSETGCHEWTGAMNPDGYGMIALNINGKQRNLSAHRVAWIVHKGPIPAKLVLDHLCRVRRCVNVDHLEPVTANENTNRGRESRRKEGWQNVATVLPSFSVDAEVWEAVKAKAAREDRKPPAVIRELLDKWLAE